MSQNNNWTEKDEASIKAIVVNMINQKQIFRSLGEKGELPESFKIQNSRDYVLGIFTGIVINLFANYWVGEHEKGLSENDLETLYQKIAQLNETIEDGLFN